MVKSKLYWEKEKKRGEKEGKKREEKEKGVSGEANKSKNKKQGEYPLILYTVNPSTSPGTFQCCLVNNLFFPCPSSWSSGGGACCADFQVLAVGGAAVPLPGAGPVSYTHLTLPTKRIV